MSSGKNKITNRKNFINRETYLEFSKKHPDISYTDYIAVLKESTKAIRDNILENPLGFKLPYNIGYIAVDKFKPLRHYRAIDWVNTRRLGKYVPLTNFHSYGYIFDIKFYPNYRISALRNYKMQAHRILNRMLAQSIKSGKQYLEIDRSYYSKRFRINEILKMD